MSTFRKNTLIVDFAVLPKRPDAARVQKFLEQDIKLQLPDTLSIQLHNIRNCVFIEMVDGETALRYQNAHNYRHEIYCGDKGFKIPVYVEKETVTVRIHDLPPQMPHTTVLEFMQQYGTAISISRERWKHFFPGYYNGVRVLQMKLDREIPSFLSINGEHTLVTYRNQPKTCRHCGRAAHPTQKCSKTAETSNNVQSPEAPDTSFASTTKTITTMEDPAPAKEKSNSMNPVIVPQYNTETNTETNTTIDSSSSSTSDSTNSAFSEAIVNQKRRLLRKKETESKKACLNQQGSQIVSQCNNRFEALVELDWMSPTDLLLMNNKNGKGGIKSKS